MLVASLADSGFKAPKLQTTHADKFNDDKLSTQTNKTQSTFHFLDGSTHEIAWSFKDRYCDEYTLEPLPHEEIKSAIVDEMVYFNENVWRGVKAETAKADPKRNNLQGSGGVGQQRGS